MKSELAIKRRINLLSKLMKENALDNNNNQDKFSMINALVWVLEKNKFK